LSRDRSWSDLSPNVKKSSNAIGRVTSNPKQEDVDEKSPVRHDPVDDDEPDDSQFVPPHTLTQEPFWSFAKVKYVESEYDAKRRHSVTGSTLAEGAIPNRTYRASSDAGFPSLRPNLRANLAGFPAPSLNTGYTSTSTPLSIGVKQQPPYNVQTFSLKGSMQSGLSRALSSSLTSSTTSSRNSSPVSILS